MALFYLTALRVSPQKAEDRAVPKVESVDTADVLSVNIKQESNGAEHVIVKVAKERYVKTIKAAENFGQYLRQTDWGNAANNPFNTGITANVAASGDGTAASATQLTTGYLNSVTAATASTMIGIRLPNASTTGKLNTPLIIRNAASVDIVIKPAAGEQLDAGTGGAATIKVGQFKHFYCSATNKWVTCKGPYF
jgi:hypothetical protein